MAEPNLIWTDDQDVEITLEDYLNFQIVNSGSFSNEFIVRLWNNKDGTEDLAAAVELLLKNLTKSGFVSGDEVANGKNEVENRWLHVRDRTAGETGFTAVGGIDTKELLDLQGSKLTTPEKPDGTAIIDQNGEMAEESYFYGVVAVDETGETILGTESDEIVVDNGANAVLLTWDGVPGAKTYKLFRTTSTGVYGTSSFLAEVETNNYTDLLEDTTEGQPEAQETCEYGHYRELGFKMMPDSMAPAGLEEAQVVVSYAWDE